MVKKRKSAKIDSSLIHRQENQAFISYSSKNQADVEQIVRFLKDNGINCWMAPGSIPPGSSYLKQIPMAIKNCGVFILMLSAESQESEWVPSEVEMAKNSRRTIIPFHMDTSELDDSFVLMLSHNQRIEACGRSDEACQELLHRICDLWGIRYPTKTEAIRQLSPYETGISALHEMVCERISADIDNRERIQHFRCARSPHMAAFLKYQGWQEDTEGATAVYLIKNRDGQVLMYFSVKCGMLYEQDFAAGMRRTMEKSRRFLSILTGRAKKEPTLEELTEIAGLEEEYGGNLDQLMWALQTKIHEAQQQLDAQTLENKRFSGSVVNYVTKTYSAVELVHLCVSDEGREYWNRVPELRHLEGTMSEVLYWQFVVPVIQEMRNLAGCQYVYTYVPDDSSEGTLTNYYKNKLHFLPEKSIGYMKPQYDFGCTFMCRKIDQLASWRKTYFRQLRERSAQTL